MCKDFLQPLHCIIRLESSLLHITPVLEGSVHGDNRQPFDATVLVIVTFINNKSKSGRVPLTCTIISKSQRNAIGKNGKEKRANKKTLRNVDGTTGRYRICILLLFYLL